MFRFIVFSVFITLCFSCKPDMPLDFFDNRFQGAMSIEDFEKVVAGVDTVWIEHSFSPEEGSRPAYKLDAVQLEGQTLLGIKGRLVAQFFNNKLESLRFIPTATEALDFEGRLCKELKICFEESKNEFDKNSKILILRNYLGQVERVFTWVDKKVSLSHHDWIMKYS